MAFHTLRHTQTSVDLRHTAAQCNACFEFPVFPAVTVASLCFSLLWATFAVHMFLFFVRNQVHFLNESVSLLRALALSLTHCHVV